VVRSGNVRLAGLPAPVRRPSALLIVAAVRKYEIDRVHPLMAFWLALTRSGLLDEIPLALLDATETGLLAANVAGGGRGRRSSPDLP